MSGGRKALRAVVSVPLSEQSCALIEELEPRLELLRDATLTAPMRGPADWSGDPAFRRTSDQQRRFDALVDSAEALFGIPDVNPAALARTVTANPHLRWVMTTAAGGGSQIKAAGLAASDLARIQFTTSAGVHGRPLAEFALMGVLLGVKDLPRLRADQAACRWPDRWEMGQLDECTVLIVGLGGIGTECVGVFRALGARVWATNRTGHECPGVDRLVPLGELHSVVGEVDAIIAALPETGSTHHLVGHELLAAVKPGVVLVNVGRGTVVDEAALVAALDEGRVGFAALDVFEQEPLPASSRLWRHPRVLVSPHTAALSDQEEERIARRFAVNATRLIEGQPLIATVDTVEFY